MQKQLESCDVFEDIMASMLSDDFCRDIIIKYYYKTIGKGDYFPLDGARKKVKSMNYSVNKEKSHIVK